MGYLRGTRRALLAHQNGQVQVLILIIAPILVLCFLGFVVRAASSAVDPTLAKNEIIAQLERRLSEIQKRADLVEEPIWDSEVDALVQAGGEEEKSVSVVIFSPAQPDASTPEVRQTVHFIKRNETLATILKKAGLPRKQMAVWIDAARKMSELRRLQLRHAMTLSYDYDQHGNPTLRTVSYDINKRSLLVLERGENGRIESRVETVPTTLVWRAVGGRIRGSLYQAATRMGVPARIIDDLADMDWDLDLSSELQPGAVFKIIFEELQADGKTLGYGKVLAAEIVNKGKTYAMFCVGAEEDANSQWTGRGAQFLRYPVRYTRISSVFTDARFHPIYKQKRPHRGVDFAAPAGTPVRAVANGTITKAGWQGAYGRFIRIAHAGPYSSAYAHLRRIRRGVKVGSIVKRGQIIGQVGSSGTATGPHLHFELHKNGKYINPLKAKLPTKRVVARQKEREPKPLDPQIAAITKKLEEYLAALGVHNEPASRTYSAIPLLQAAARTSQAAARTSVARMHNS